MILLSPFLTMDRSWLGVLLSMAVTSIAVQDQLKNVQQIQASAGAFAAILDDGSVVAWGDVHHGCDSSTVQDQLKNVQKIQATKRP